MLWSTILYTKVDHFFRTYVIYNFSTLFRLVKNEKKMSYIAKWCQNIPTTVIRNNIHSRKEWEWRLYMLNSRPNNFGMFPMGHTVYIDTLMQTSTSLSRSLLKTVYGSPNDKMKGCNWRFMQLDSYGPPYCTHAKLLSNFRQLRLVCYLGIVSICVRRTRLDTTFVIIKQKKRPIMPVIVIYRQTISFAYWLSILFLRSFFFSKK